MLHLPHSCARTQSPIATVPVTAEYAAHIGKVNKLVPIVATIPAPTAVHNAVPIKDTERYPKDLAVSGTKQSFGITALISFEIGKSSADKESALPFNPYNGFRSKTNFEYAAQYLV